MEDIKKQQISAEESELISKKLSEKIKNYACVMCGEKNWVLESYIVPIPVSNDISFKIGGRILPLVTLICTNCGNTHFFNLAILGLSEKIKGKTGGSK